jgi:hypothetical protein
MSLLEERLMSATDIEKRVAAVERELARLKASSSVARPTHPIQSLERIHGTFENDEAFQEAARLGRRWRKGQRTPVRKTKAKRR